MDQGSTAIAPAPYFSVGLTGGIGCGKSTVADLFAARGAAIVDTDVIAHSLTAPGGAAMAELVRQFGAGVVDGSGAMDRGKMRELVFSDALAKQRLEAILHPLIRAATLQAAAQANGSYVIFAVPLLVESGGWAQRVRRVLVIDCPESLQISRVMARNSLPEARVKSIMATQATRAQRLAAADDVIDNGGDVAALLPQIERLHALYLDFSTTMAANRAQRL